MEPTMKKNVLRKSGFFIFWLVLSICNIRAANPVDTLRPKNIISFNLVTPFDPNFPRLRIGYTFMITPNLSQSIEIGYGRRFMFPDSTFYADQSLSRSYKLWEIRTETRYYMAGIRKHVIPYVGLELYQIRNRQILFDKSFEREWDETVVYYDQANYRRLKAGFNLKSGLIFRLNPVLALELYGGLGTRYKHNRYTNVIEGGDGDDTWSWDLFEDLSYYYKEGSHWSINLTGGFKIDFLF
jgi:hypothetical protein